MLGPQLYKELVDGLEPGTETICRGDGRLSRLGCDADGPRGGLVPAACQSNHPSRRAALVGSSGSGSRREVDPAPRASSRKACEGAITTVPDPPPLTPDGCRAVSPRPEAACNGAPTREAPLEWIGALPFRAARRCCEHSAPRGRAPSAGPPWLLPLADAEPPRPARQRASARALQ